MAARLGMDEIERASVAAEGYDPDDPDVVAALAQGSPSSPLRAFSASSLMIVREAASVLAPRCQAT